MATTIGKALLTLVRDLFFASFATDKSHGRQLHDTGLIGELNHRTGRLDAGNDPYGWYDEG